MDRKFGPLIAADVMAIEPFLGSVTTKLTPP
ncbi:hypothetical protein DFJ75_3506 [Williamsia muralis]|uniref:Uncharacterized protein n=1 Tax=Williamsia marianensis TaxID=85044 RepID=A0A495K5T0_WILMA|nr:hypothetical protein DFJ75_3506 [Williamsia muralis]